MIGTAVGKWGTNLMLGFRRVYTVCVKTEKEDMEFPYADSRVNANQCLNCVGLLLGLREWWFFGLQYNVNNTVAWLDQSQTFRRQGVPMKDPIIFRLLIKFYPENVEELLDDVTRHLFFLQLKRMILEEEIYCPPEVSVLLASYDVHAEYGDYDPDVHKPGFLAGKSLLPKRFINLYVMTTAMWEEKITALYAQHRGKTREEAEMEYLKIAQDLDMYGVNYFLIRNMKGHDLLLGLHALGLHIYKPGNNLTPELTFVWDEIHYVSCNWSTFVITILGRKNCFVKFKFQDRKLSLRALHLFVGNHVLFRQRRKPDSVEVQQLKIQATWQRARKEEVKQRLQKERQLRQAAERARDELETRLIQLQNKVCMANELLLCLAENMLDQEAKMAGEEVKLLTQKATEAETAKQFNEVNVGGQEEQEKMLEAGMLALKMDEESEMRDKEAEQVIWDLQEARDAEREVKHKQLEITSKYQSPGLPSDSTPRGPSFSRENLSSDFKDTDMKSSFTVTEKKKAEKSKTVPELLKEMTMEMELLRVRGHETPLDCIYFQNRAKGITKHSTLKMLTLQSTTSKLAHYESL